jgi:hypothetical protein
MSNAFDRDQVRRASEFTLSRVFQSASLAVMASKVCRTSGVYEIVIGANLLADDRLPCAFWRTKSLCQNAILINKLKTNFKIIKLTIDKIHFVWYYSGVGLEEPKEKNNVLCYRTLSSL